MDKSINKSIPSQKPRLLDLVRAAIRTRHYSMRTEEAYIYWIQGCDTLMRTQLLPIQIQIVTSESCDKMDYSTPKEKYVFNQKQHPVELEGKEINESLSEKASGAVVARSVSFDKSSGHVLRRSNLSRFTKSDCEPKKQASAKSASQ